LKFVELADPAAAADKLVEIANGVEVVQDSRIYIKVDIADELRRRNSVREELS
jgi:hypothetical protein